MKLIGFLCYLLSLTACLGDDHRDQMLKLAPDVDLGEALPENYDWLAYIGAANSVSDEMTRAWSGIKYVEPRLEKLLGECRAILRKNEDDLQAFENINNRWVQADDAEVAWVSAYWEGGSQRRAAVPRARLRTLLRRIRNLEELRHNSGLFNQ
jgi:hypothetical protein